MPEVDRALTKVNPVDILTSGKITKNDIGKTVYLSNSAIVCQEWRIADVNHDGTSGTVDLFSKYTLTNSGMVFSGNTQYYASSSLRSYLTGTVYNGFASEVQNALKTQNFQSNDSTLSDKVKCPSLREAGNNYTAYVVLEGDPYPIFGCSLNPNRNSIYKMPNGNTACYWMRSRNISSSSLIYAINSSGFCCNYDYNSSNYVVACLRF